MRWRSGGHHDGSVRIDYDRGFPPHREVTAFRIHATTGTTRISRSDESGAGIRRDDAAGLLERPIDEILDIGEDERLRDSTTVDNTVHPFRVISKWSKPAEWIYLMNCCGAQALASDPCHEPHLQRPRDQRYCSHCSDPFSILADGARAVYRV
jgi:hypothetical protein